MQLIRSANRAIFVIAFGCNRICIKPNCLICVYSSNFNANAAALVCVRVLFLFEVNNILLVIFIKINAGFSRWATNDLLFTFKIYNLCWLVRVDLLQNVKRTMEFIARITITVPDAYFVFNWEKKGLVPSFSHFQAVDG